MREDASEIIHELSGSIFRLIRGIVRNREEALDLTQDVLVRLLNGPAPDDPTRLKGYAMKAAYHAALNAVRARKRRTRIHEQLQGEAESLAADSSELDQPEEMIHLRRNLLEALAKLSAKQREAIEYRFYGGLKTEEISAAMNISSGSVKVHLYRALGRLSELLTTSKKEKQI